MLNVGSPEAEATERRGWLVTPSRPSGGTLEVEAGTHGELKGGGGATTTVTLGATLPDFAQA